MLLLAGCLGAEEPPAGVEPADAPAADGSPRAPATGGDAPAAQDLGHQPHIHDYWLGRERVTLFDGEVQAGPENSTFGALFTATFAREARVGWVDFLLPDGSIVYEGTGQMEVTAAWSDPAVTSLGVSAKPANTPEYGPVLPLENGGTLVLTVSPEMTDMPHMTTSRWAFLFTAGESPGAAMGPFHLRIDVVKMRDVGLFPGHPDLFGGKTEKVLMQAHHRTEKAAYATRGAYLVQNGDFGEPEFQLADLVPMETKRLRVEVIVTGAEATAGEVTEARFFYRGADTSQLRPGGDPVEGSFEEGRLVWEVPVEMEMTDSPYSPESQWWLMVEPATQLSDADPTCGGCVDSALEFDVVVTAYRAAE